MCESAKHINVTNCVRVFVPLSVFEPVWFNTIKSQFVPDRTQNSGSLAWEKDGTTADCRCSFVKAWQGRRTLRKVSSTIHNYWNSSLNT